jgi:uncharacterized membrane protein
VQTIKLIVILAAGAAAADFLWIGVIAKRFYETRLGDLLRPSGAQFDVRIFAAIAVYLLLAAGIALFVIPHADAPCSALAWGALFGFLMYAVYDCTNIAILSRWPLSVALVDILWGTTLCALVACAGFYLKGFLS